MGAIESQICSACVNYKVLADENVSENINSVGCGKPNAAHNARKDCQDLACSSQSTCENVTPETADDGKESNGDEPHDEDFLPKDLLRFAWQIAQGMVNNVRLMFKCHLERWVSHYAYVI